MKRWSRGRGGGRGREGGRGGEDGVIWEAGRAGARFAFGVESNEFCCCFFGSDEGFFLEGGGREEGREGQLTLLCIL